VLARSTTKGFPVKSYYVTLLTNTNRIVPWKSIWKTKAPTRVAFFVWTAAMGRILTIDNLRRRRVLVMNWCCMCKKSGESITHLFLHCPVASELWSLIFSIFGVQWVMPSGVMALLACWRNGLGQSRNIEIWRAAPHCVLWCIWGERNSRCFEDKERNLLEIKNMLIHSLKEWSAAANLVPHSSTIDFLDSCNP
jgi:hypothetical protein